MKGILLALISLNLAACSAKSTPTTTADNSNTTNNTMTTTTPPNNDPNIEVITLGGGCFWCIEAVFLRLDGVISAESGYSGGSVKNPAYREVCSGLTGHAEVVQVTFDKTKTNLAEVLQVFFTVHDPTTLNRQGADQGTQYRSAIFYRDEAQKTEAEAIIKDLNASGTWTDPIVTEVTPFKVFYKAEDYHQDYYNNNKSQGYCQIVVRPKVEKFEKVFKDRIKH